eukprot:2017094-Prymnesium_polylepis.2
MSRKHTASESTLASSACSVGGRCALSTVASSPCVPVSTTTSAPFNATFLALIVVRTSVWCMRLFHPTKTVSSLPAKGGVALMVALPSSCVPNATARTA